MIVPTPARAIAYRLEHAMPYNSLHDFQHATALVCADKTATAASMATYEVFMFNDDAWLLGRRLVNDFEATLPP